MDRLPSRRAVLAVRAVKAAATASAAGTAIVLTLGGATANPPSGRPASSDSARQVEWVALDARCAGFSGRTLVRTPGGRTKAVPFEQGWQVYRGERPGTLVVVCPDQPGG